MEHDNGRMRNCCNLPEEIIIDILTRLPANSVGRCRCASKSWRALLSQPNFIRTHLEWSRKIRRESLILLSDSMSFYSAPLSDADHLFDEITISATKLSFASHHDSWIRVYASCDGLLFVRDESGNKFVLNPITREIRKVPDSPFSLDSDGCRFTLYGFGYDSVSDDYKIVTNNGNGFDCGDMFVNVYSLKNDSWKAAGSSTYKHLYSHFNSGVFVDGYIHWLASSPSKGSDVIVAFDLVEEKFSEMTPPSLIAEHELHLYRLASLDGCLCLFGKYICLMKEYGVAESWTKFTIHDLQEDETTPLCMLGPEQVVLLKDDEKLVVYNIKEKTLVDIVVHGTTEAPRARGSFVESLISPHAGVTN